MELTLSTAFTFEKQNLQPNSVPDYNNRNTFEIPVKCEHVAQNTMAQKATI